MAFWIGVAECSLRLPYAGSLKERRHVVRSILDGVRNRFSSLRQTLGLQTNGRMQCWVLPQPVLLHLSLKKGSETWRASWQEGKLRVILR